MQCFLDVSQLYVRLVQGMSLFVHFNGSLRFLDHVEEFLAELMY